MRTLIYIVLSLTLAATALGQDEPKKKPAAGEKKPAAEGTLSTPFGVAKTTKPAAAKARPKKIQQNWQVEKVGQDFKFSKKTPFGPSSWTRTEADLSDGERDVAERSGLLKPKEEPVAVEAETAAKPL